MKWYGANYTCAHYSGPHVSHEHQHTHSNHVHAVTGPSVLPCRACGRVSHAPKIHVPHFPPSADGRNIWRIIDGPPPPGLEFGGEYTTVVLSSPNHCNFNTFLKGWWVLQLLYHLGPW
jgi:hypothetical protein